MDLSLPGLVVQSRWLSFCLEGLFISYFRFFILQFWERDFCERVSDILSTKYCFTSLRLTENDRPNIVHRIVLYRCTAPVVVDKKAKKIVTNESRYSSIVVGPSLPDLHDAATRLVPYGTTAGQLARPEISSYYEITIGFVPPESGEVEVRY